MMWSDNSVFYQIYPLGFCGAPKENDGKLIPRIRKVTEWIPHLKRLHVDAIYFSPVFESDRHGYDTRDYRKIDCRLGSNEDFSDVCKELKENGIRVVLDGVLTMWDVAFGPFRMSLKSIGIRNTRIGSIFTLMAIPATTMAFGMRVGKGTLSL